MSWLTSSKLVNGVVLRGGEPQVNFAKHFLIVFGDDNQAQSDRNQQRGWWTFLLRGKVPH